MAHNFHELFNHFSWNRFLVDLIASLVFIGLMTILFTTHVVPRVSCLMHLPTPVIPPTVVDVKLNIQPTIFTTNVVDVDVEWWTSGSGNRCEGDSAPHPNNVLSAIAQPLPDLETASGLPGSELPAAQATSTVQRKIEIVEREIQRILPLYGAKRKRHYPPRVRSPLAKFPAITARYEASGEPRFGLTA